MLSKFRVMAVAIAIAVMTLGYANPSFADKPNNGEHDHGGGDGAGGAMFDVIILGGGLDGGSGLDDPWLQGFGGKNSIGLNDATAGLDVGMLMGLDVLTGEDESCFPPDTGDDHASASDFPLHQAIVKRGKQGSVEASFWFHGATDDGSVEVLYVLKLFGDIDGNVEFPGTADLSMDEWELKVENEGRKIKKMSCESQGTDIDVTITVTKQ